MRRPFDAAAHSASLRLQKSRVRAHPTRGAAPKFKRRSLNGTGRKPTKLRVAMALSLVVGLLALLKVAPTTAVRAGLSETDVPTTSDPTHAPTNFPTGEPTTSDPTRVPTRVPTREPTKEPTRAPTTPHPTANPTVSYPSLTDYVGDVGSGSCLGSCPGAKSRRRF